MTCEIRWKPEIVTERCILRPVKEDDLPDYKALFQNVVAMEKNTLGAPGILRRDFRDG